MTLQRSSIRLGIGLKPWNKHAFILFLTSGGFFCCAAFRFDLTVFIKTSGKQGASRRCFPSC